MRCGMAVAQADALTWNASVGNCHKTGSLETPSRPSGFFPKIILASADVCLLCQTNYMAIS